MKKILSFLLLLIAAISFGQVKISDLPPLTTGFSNNAFVPITKGGTTYKATLDGFAKADGSNITGSWYFVNDLSFGGTLQSTSGGFVIYQDGTGQLANGNLSWGANGNLGSNGWLLMNDGGMSFGANGSAGINTTSYGLTRIGDWNNNGNGTHLFVNDYAQRIEVNRQIGNANDETWNINKDGTAYFVDTYTGSYAEVVNKNYLLSASWRSDNASVNSADNSSSDGQPIASQYWVNNNTARIDGTNVNAGSYWDISVTRAENADNCTGGSYSAAVADNATSDNQPIASQYWVQNQGYGTSNYNPSFSDDGIGGISYNNGSSTYWSIRDDGSAEFTGRLNSKSELVVGNVGDNNVVYIDANRVFTHFGLLSDLYSDGFFDIDSRGIIQIGDCAGDYHNTNIQIDDIHSRISMLASNGISIDGGKWLIDNNGYITTGKSTGSGIRTSFGTVTIGDWEGVVDNSTFTINGSLANRRARISNAALILDRQEASVITTRTTEKGMMYYNYDTNKIVFYDGTSWQQLNCTPM